MGEPCLISAKEEWLAWRRAGIGSSDASAVMDCSKWSTPFELMIDKIGLSYGRVRNYWEWKAMNRGIELEPEARTVYENYSGILMPAKRILHPVYPQLRATCDGFNEEQNKVLEIKCPGKTNHLKALRGNIPKQYFWQCVHLLMVSNADCLDYWSYDEDCGVAVTMYRDLAVENRLLQAELRFWDWVQEKKIFLSRLDQTDTSPTLKSNVIPLFRR